MHRIVIHKYAMSRNTVLGLTLIGVWFAGLSLGFVAARFYGDTLVSCLSLAAGSQATLATPLVTLFPLLVSALAVIIIHPNFLYAICFVRGIILAMMLQALTACYDSGIYLAALFLLFSCMLFSPVLLWYWWRRLSLQMDNFIADTLVCAAVGIVIGLIDYWFISPFLVDVVIF